MACGAKPEPTSGKLDTTYPASVQDGSGRLITVEAPPRLVLVVTGGPERLLARLGIRAAVAPEDVTVARIRAAHPDLVVVGPGITTADEQRNESFISKLATPVYVMPGGRLEDIERGAVALGLLTNNAEAGRAIALSLRRQRQDITQRLANVAPLDVYVDAGFGTSIQRTTLLARLLVLRGSAARRACRRRRDGQRRILHKLDPDAYIATSTSGVTLARLRSQPAMRTLRAVEDGHVYVVDAAAARADTTAYALMRSLAHSLHPSVIKR